MTAALPASANDFSVGAHSSMATFRQEETPPAGQAAIVLSAARGESESFQLVVKNDGSQPLGDVRIEVAGLRGVEVAVYAQAAVHVPTPGRSGGAKPGHYFDLLRPLGNEAIAAGAFGPYWIDLKVLPDAAPGRQEGQVTVVTSAGRRVLPLRLSARQFTLPPVPSLKLAFAFGLSWMEAYYGRKLTTAEIHAAQNVMLEHRLGPVPMWGDGRELFGDEAQLKHCLANGLNVVLLACGGQTDEQIDRSLAALGPKIELLRRLNALDRTYLFGYDEITMSAPEQIPAMRKAYERFHERYPQIRRINTSVPDARLRGFVDIFVVPTSRFLPSMLQPPETWWYSVGADNLSAEPDFRIDFPATAQRAFFLADWQAGVSAHLYWAVQREWPANRGIGDREHPERQWRTGYEHAFSKAWIGDNGGGNLFYPAADGSMLTTPRVKRIRDGVDDYEYLAQLRTALAQLDRDSSPAARALGKQARQLLDVPEEIIRLGGGWCEGWQIRQGDPSACSITTHPRAIHGGQQALRIAPQSGTVQVAQELPVQVGVPGNATAWIKTDDLGGTARLVVEFRDAEGRVVQTAATEPVTGSTGKFVERTVALPGPAPGVRKLCLLLSVEGVPAATTKNAPIQKAFFDDIAIAFDGRPAPLANADFEIQRLRIGRDPNLLLTYRDRVADCLDRCLQALRD